MSGPYAVAAFSDAVFFGEVTRGTPLFLTFTAIGYQKAYGDVYSSPTDIFEARYATGIEALLPSSVPLICLKLTWVPPCSTTPSSWSRKSVWK